MFHNIYIILVAVILFDFGNLYPIIQHPTNCCQGQQGFQTNCCQGQQGFQTNCCQGQQGCTHCPTTSISQTTYQTNYQSQQSCTPCPQTANCGQCHQPCVPCSTTVAQTYSTNFCCNQPCNQCHQPSCTSCPTNSCCASCCTQPTPMPPVPPVPTVPPVPPVPTVKPVPIVCPENTIKVNDKCLVVFCGTGIYRNGKCIQTLCPSGTVWTGTQCEAPIPHNHTTITIINTVNTNLSYATNQTMNFDNKIDIFIPDLSTPPSRPNQCCIVVTPNTCSWDNSQYECRSRSYRTCSPVCSSSHMYLRPPSFMQTPPLSCGRNDCYNGHSSFYPDCSNCYNTNYDCGQYCQRKSICQVRQCQSIDIRAYCTSYPGSIGCREMDGCNGDWCNEY